MTPGTKGNPDPGGSPHCWQSRTGVEWASGLAPAPVEGWAKGGGSHVFPQHIRAVRPPVRFYENGWAYRSKSLGFWKRLWQLSTVDQLSGPCGQ